MRRSLTSISAIRPGTVAGRRRSSFRSLPQWGVELRAAKSPVEGRAPWLIRVVRCAAEDGGRKTTGQTLLRPVVCAPSGGCRQRTGTVSRVLSPGGVISMVDETHTPFARFFFGTVHPEPYDDKAAFWSFPEGHSMLDSNQALTWIVFDRDRERFAREFPELTLEQRSFLPWFSYLMSGGMNLRTFFPKFLTAAVGAANRLSGG
jgi:hypothetical protein